jgi:hypothetical protein
MGQGGHLSVWGLRRLSQLLLLLLLLLLQM